MWRYIDTFSARYYTVNLLNPEKTKNRDTDKPDNCETEEERGTWIELTSFSACPTNGKEMSQL